MCDELEKGFMNAERAGTFPCEVEDPKLGLNGVAVMYEPSTESQKAPREPRGLSHPRGHCGQISSDAI